MAIRILAIVLSTLSVSTIAVAANEAAVADPFAPLQRGYEDLPIEGGMNAAATSYATLPSGLAMPASAVPAVVHAAAAPRDSSGGPPVIDQASYWSAPVVGPVGPPCPCDSVYRNSAWLFDTEIIPTQSHITDGQFGEWPDDGALALRFNLGYENFEGYGIRGRLWVFGQSAEAQSDEVDLAAAAFNLDFYKRLFLEGTELVLGAGPAGSALMFELEDGSESEFSGSGLGVLTEVWHPLVRFEKTDIGAVGRGRVSLLVGEWDDRTGFVIPDTEHDSLTAIELAWGIELRRRFGRLNDRYWSIALLAEHQNWDSQWMGEFLDTSVAFTGTNIKLGLSW